MKIQNDCIACIFRQVLEASKMVTDDEDTIRKTLNKYARMIPEIKKEDTAPLIVNRIQKYIKEVSGEKDPYYKFKKKNIKLAQEHYLDVEKVLKKADDPLLVALTISAVGNSIDAGVSLDVDIKGNVDLGLDAGFKQSDYSKFKTELKQAESLLIIADNAGEAVFDKLLIKVLNKDYDLNITYAVRNSPILNDVTLKEAKLIGIDQICNVISSGCDTPGLMLDYISEEFRNIFVKTDIIISKGQGNLEGLLGTGNGIYFLFKIKCDLIARVLGNGLNTGDFIFKYF